MLGRPEAPHNPAMRLSVIVICLNEAANIQACLQSVAFADECIVLDSGSTDGTQAIARACGAKLFEHADWPGFGLQKNRALALAQGEWVLSLDADERVSPALAIEIQQAMANPARVAYEIPRQTQFCGQWIRHCGWTPDRVLRLFRRGQAQFTPDRVHERLVPTPGQAYERTQRLSAPLLHYSYPTPAHYWRKLQAYSMAWAEQRFAKGQTTSMTRAALSGLTAFLRSYILQLGFLDGAMGFAVCSMQAQGAFGKYFTLYCLHRQHATQQHERV